MCPVCRGAGDGRRVELAWSREDDAGHVVQGILRCTGTDCLSEYPIVDGIPLLVRNLREHVARDIGHIQARDDLCAEIESVLGDCCGPGSPFDTTRQQLSGYAWDHWADLDPEESAADPAWAPGGAVRLLDEALACAGPLPDGPLLDAGCATGRAAFALAARFDGPVLGVDLNVAMLRVAAGALRDARVRYPRRRVGLVYDRREFPVALPGAERVDFWACDAADLPFRDATFAAIAGLNLLDSVHSPADVLASVARCLMPGGKALLACPYDWSPGATAVEAWVGGHSQRGEHRGASEPVLRALLTAGAHPASIGGLRIVAEAPAVPWRVRLHERAAVDYRTHLLVVEKVGGGGPSRRV